jgi:biopolymer transport protein ExbB/TolQ
MSKQKAIALMLLGYMLLVFLLTVAMVEIEKLQERVNAIEVNNISYASKNDLQAILRANKKDRETVQGLRNDFNNWSNMWDEMFEGRK